MIKSQYGDKNCINRHCERACVYLNVHQFNETNATPINTEAFSWRRNAFRWISHCFYFSFDKVFFRNERKTFSTSMSQSANTASRKFYRITVRS